jgi:hypothetical protein
VHLQAVLAAWLPLAKTVLDMTCLVLPSPLQTPEDRFNTLLRAGLDPGQELPPVGSGLLQSGEETDGLC